MQRTRNALLALTLALTALWVGTPASAAQQYKLDQTRPTIMAAAAQQADAPFTGSLASSSGRATPLYADAPRFAKTTPQREVFGFVNAGNLGSGSVGYLTWNYNMLTTIAYFGVGVNYGDGTLVTNDTGWNVLVSQTMTNFIARAHAYGVRVILSLDLHDFSTSPTSRICLGLAAVNTARTISMAITAVQTVGADGINIDYEGNINGCWNGITSRDEMTTFAHDMRAAMPAGMYLAVDTYSGSAEDNQEFFNVTGLAPSVDSFFVMAYDMDYSNSGEVPLNCTSYCFNPISPLNTYRFNDSKSMAQYTALVPASKVILGQPLYGRRGCVANGTTAHQYPTPGKNFVAPTYAYASTIPSQPGVFSFAAHRDPGDGVSEWDTWYDSDWACNREQYFDDVTSFSAKFNLVNSMNLRGVGFFTLDYAGAAPELWLNISTYFSCPVTVNLPATESTTEFAVGLTAGTCAVSYFDVQIYDSTLNQGWEPLNPITATASSGTGTADGFAGHSYMVRARSHTTAGLVSAWSVGNTTIDPAATRTLPFSGLYTLDLFGGVHADSSGPLSATSYWPGWNIARSGRAWPGATAPQSGFVLDGWGGLHPYGAPGLAETSDSATHYWKGWDIARDFAFLPDGTGGFVLDGFGGLHPFRVNGATGALAAVGNTYWPGHDYARKVVIFADGTGGYVLDYAGGLHPFGINGPSPVSPQGMQITGYWPNLKIVRDVVLIAGDSGHAGYVLDAYGGMHPFHPSGDASTMPPVLTTVYWPGWDLARGAWMLPGSATAGYILDAWGGEHPFGGAPSIVNYPYWPNHDIARTTWGA